MGSLNAETDSKQDMDDSGYVQDEALNKEATSQTYKGTTNLLDLSDDVLLYILRYCSPRDLKALGFTCTRLSTVSVDRTLWQRVDARECPTGRLRMRWLLTHALNSHTNVLLLSGYAKEAKGCLGFMRGSRDDPEADSCVLQVSTPIPGDNNEPVPRMLTVAAQSLRRYGGGFPFWPDRAPASRPVAAGRKSGVECSGPQVTLTAPALHRLSTLCTSLTQLALENCVIDCAKTNISMFPSSLKKLSLRATKCYNLEKSFLFKIQDRLVLLEELDVSQCDWIEPACMLPLSKVERLSKLVMRGCPKLTEFVAYASLATRYGFKALKVLDLRGSPVGDSEVSALGWVTNLEELYLSPAVPAEKDPEHAHYVHDPWPSFTELEAWEETEPEYYKARYATQQWIQDEIEALDSGEANCVPLEDSAMASCFLMERLFAEPVVPDQYSEVYERFNPHTHRLNLTSPDDYRQAYGLYMNRPTQQSENMAYIISGIARRNREIREWNEHRANGHKSTESHSQQDPEDRTKRDKRKSDGPSETGPAKRQKTKASKKHYDEQSGDKEKDDGDVNKGDTKNKDPKGDEQMDTSSDDDDDDDKGPAKIIPIPVNQGASTSKVIIIEGHPSTSRCDIKIQQDGTVQFRQKPPIVFEVSNNNNTDEPNLNRGGHLSIKISKLIQEDLKNIKVSANPTPKKDESSSNTSEDSQSTSNSQESQSESQKANSNSEKSDLTSQQSDQNGPLNPAASSSSQSDLNSQHPSSSEASTSKSDNNNLNDENQPGSSERKSTNSNTGNNQESNSHRVVYVHPQQIAAGRDGGSIRINRFMPPGFVYDPNVSHRLEYTSLVTDSAIRRFGRADGENINYVQIGPFGPMPAPLDDPRARPDRSNLRILSVTGYRFITNVSLTHLATAAPRLQFLNVTGTRVTNLGVEHFKNFRPNCEVLYGLNETTKEPN